MLESARLRWNTAEFTLLGGSNTPNPGTKSTLECRL